MEELFILCVIRKPKSVVCYVISLRLLMRSNLEIWHVERYLCYGDVNVWNKLAFILFYVKYGRYWDNYM